MPKQYYSFDEYSVDESDDDHYSYVSDKSEKTYTPQCRCNKCHKLKRDEPPKYRHKCGKCEPPKYRHKCGKCEPPKDRYKCGKCEKYNKHSKRSDKRSSKSDCSTEEKCIIIKIRPCK